jgi:uncharacterized protein (TIGR01777 family)
MQTILISGGSGLIGTDLRKYFTALGYSSRILSRKSTNKKDNSYYWNITDKTIDPYAFEDVDIVINLAGSSIIGGRWTKARKKELAHSRVDSTQLLIDTINQQNLPVKHFIQASAMGYYGNSMDQIITTESPKGNDFMANLCSEWEAASNKLNPTVKKSILRIGLYLSLDGGVYPILSQLARFNILSAFGNGQMWAGYTHHLEFADLIHQIIQDKIPSDTYNAVGAQPFQMNELIKCVIQKSGKANFLPNVPAFLLKLVLGEASATLLNSYKITSPKLASHEIYKYEGIKQAIQSL